MKCLAYQQKLTPQRPPFLQDHDKAPTERFALPVTGNMEYGFFAKLQTVSEGSSGSRR